MEQAKPSNEVKSLTQIYRTTTPGIALQESLKEMVEIQQITPYVAMQIMNIFDKTTVSVLETKAKNKISLKGHISSYRFCENVWTLVIKDAEIKDFAISKRADYLKIIAVDCKVIAPK